MPFSITKKEKMTESMSDYLDQINKKVSRIQIMAAGNLEKQIEDKRAQKLRDKEQEKQTKALQEIAKLAIKQKTGARGLRSILETLLIDLMFKSPDYKDLEKVLVNKDVVNRSAEPIMIYNNKNTNQKILVNKS